MNPINTLLLAACKDLGRLLFQLNGTDTALAEEYGIGFARPSPDEVEARMLAAGSAIARAEADLLMANPGAALESVHWSQVDREVATTDGIRHATHAGVLDIAGHKIRCYTLNSGERVFDCEDVERMLGITREGGPV